LGSSESKLSRQHLWSPYTGRPKPVILCFVSVLSAKYGDSALNLAKRDSFHIITSLRFVSVVIILPEKYYLSLPADIGEPLRI
jgi:hypothetical protein